MDWLYSRKESDILATNDDYWNSLLAHAVVLAM